MAKKFIFISGGVISGVGKGIITASIAKLLLDSGHKISLLKADPYLNIDAGTMSPLEHGETFVLEDGFETDMDIGTYERFTGLTLTKNSSITSGQVFRDILEKERKLDYKGKWISIDKHFPHELIEKIKRLGEKEQSEIVIIEIGGTAGELGHKLFLEANRILKTKLNNDVAHIHVTYLPTPDSLGEMKSKPAQLSVAELNRSGIHPDILITRSVEDLDDKRLEHLADCLPIKKQRIISLKNLENVYAAPSVLEKQNLVPELSKLLGLKNDNRIQKLKFSFNVNKPKSKLEIGIVGKYYQSGKYKLEDSYVSVVEAIKHAAWKQDIDPYIKWFVADNLNRNKKEQKNLTLLDGVIIPQGWGKRGTEGKIKAVKIVKENAIPFLGLCFGMQMAVVEHARNVIGISTANSEEVDPKTNFPVIHMMNNQRRVIKKKNYGGTIRLGAYPCVVSPGTILSEVYSKYQNKKYNDEKLVQERHRHRYEFNSKYKELFEMTGMIVSGTSPDGKLVEAIELDREIHPFFLGTQFHPELKSSLENPHPIFMGFIDACLQNF